MKLQGTAAGGVFQWPCTYNNQVSLLKNGGREFKCLPVLSLFFWLIKFLFHSLIILLRGKCKGHWWWKAHCHKFCKKTSRSYNCQIHWKKDIFLTIISGIITYPWAKDKHWLLLCTICKKWKIKPETTKLL